jgi:hypothetical protein
LKSRSKRQRHEQEPKQLAENRAKKHNRSWSQGEAQEVAPISPPRPFVCLIELDPIASRQIYFSGHTMIQDIDVSELQSKAEARLASLKDEKLVTRIAVLSTSLGQGKITKRLMIGISIETHKTSPDFDQKKCDQARSRIMQALGDIDCDVFVEMDR